MGKYQHKLTVAFNKQVTPKLFHLKFEESELEKMAKPGQFVDIRVNEGLEPLFRRPFGVFRAQKGLEIFYEKLGKGTEILASKKTGDQLDVLGPLGNSFEMPSSKIKQVVLIGGGIGVAPLLPLADKLKDRKLDLMLLYGARNKDYVFNLDAFKENGCKVFISTDDGSHGKKGLISTLFENIALNESTMIYTCGPKPMMGAVQQFAKDNNLSAQCSCEERMACGVGVCLGCVIKTIHGYKTVCHDGPVFDLEEVIF